MAAKDSLVIRQIFGGRKKDCTRSPATAQHKGKRKAEGASFPALKKISAFLKNFRTVLREISKTIVAFTLILVSFIGLSVSAVCLVKTVDAIRKGKPLPTDLSSQMLNRIIFRGR